MREPPARKVLAKEVRASKALTPALKRYWLAVLPHLHPADHARLHAILRGDAAPNDAAPNDAAPNDAAAAGEPGG